ncbi:protein-disulfide reductase DsbD family protein [Pseudomonadota bacterium]|nr:protein-disulfide reductase DsbD family protein [Pseudomonadota bacterium]
MNSRTLLYSFVFLSGFIFSNVQFEQKDILSVDEAFLLTTLIEENTIVLSWEIKPGYYLYKKSILIKVGDDSLEHNYILKNESKISDEFFGDSVILKGALKVDAKLSDVNLSRLQSIKIIYQGCAEGKYCYPKKFKSL